MKSVFFSLYMLENVARQTLLQYDKNILNSPPKAVDIERIIEKLGVDIFYTHITNNGRILGKTVFNEGLTTNYNNTLKEYRLISFTNPTIMVDMSLLECTNNGRLRFTLAHELAHYILHKEKYENTSISVALVEKTVDTSEEWQANTLASCLLMPNNLLKKSFYEHKEKTINKNETIKSMMNIFEVSEQALLIRLKTCNLI